MVIGHNPGISAAAIALAPEAVSTDLPTCGTLTMTVNCANWSLIDRRCVRETERDAPRRFFDFSQKMGTFLFSRQQECPSF